MFGDEKNLKDSAMNSKVGSIITDTYSPISYTKTEKLVTALYMVTDIIDVDEPLRNKLRTLGVGVLSDMHLIKQNNNGNTMSFMLGKISEVMSFLNIAGDMNIISEMNCNILHKEFSELGESVKDSARNVKSFNKQINLTDFFTEELPSGTMDFGNTNLRQSQFRTKYDSVGQSKSRSVGVQKGSTLLGAIKKMSDKVPVPHKAGGIISGSFMGATHHTTDVFDALKKERQNSIVSIIKSIGTGATIKDIKDMAQTNPKQAGSINSCSEKTLQRELVSMVKIGVLYKTGDKRWSRYFSVN